jgi:arsenite-transporting ATPase
LGELTVGASFTPPSDRALYLVGGKGGVGKSTVAAALGVALAAGGRRVLLLSVDPAGSLAEVLDQEVGAIARPVDGAPGLWARQLDSGAQWEEFRSRYRMETERIFGTLLSGGLSASSDRDVVARLVDLAPAGMDELAALMEVVDVTEDRPYDALVLDTAPTGHFLRLLELPEVALDWTHQVMGLLLKYREVVRPGELAGRLLRLAQSLHRFVARMRDSESTWALSVALPEALSVPESRRLLRRLNELGVQPRALLINRLLRDGHVHPPAAYMAGRLAEAAGGLPLAGAPDELVGPRGPESLAAFAGGWRLLSPRWDD